MEINICISTAFRFQHFRSCFWVLLKFPINLQRISTAGNLRGFIFATSWTELIRVDDRLQELTFF